MIIYIDTFSPILSDNRFDDGWYMRKKSIKKFLFEMRGNCKYNIRDVYPEINKRFIKELLQSRWWSRNMCMVLCLQGHQKAGFLLYDVLTKLSNIVYKWKKR